MTPTMTDAEAKVWQLPKPKRDDKLGIKRTAVPSPLRTEWKDLLRADVASPSGLRAKIAAVFEHFDTPHAALALIGILYNWADQARWSAAEKDQFIEIIQSETVAVFERFNAVLNQIGSEKAAKMTASDLPRTSSLTLTDDNTYILATPYGRAHGDLLLAMKAERNTLAVLFEDYLAWAEEAGAAKAIIAQARVDYMRLFQVVFPDLKKLADNLDIDQSRIELRLAAMYNEFRPESSSSRDFWQAFTDQLQFWRMVSDPLQGVPDHDQTGHLIVLLLLLEGFRFGGAFRRSRLEAQLAPVRMRVDLAQRLMGEAQERASRADQHLRQLIATRSALLSQGDDGAGAEQGQHENPWAEIEAAWQESESAAAELADRQAELGDAMALIVGDDPKRQRFARRLWRATQRAGKSTLYQLPWGMAFAVATALILARIEVAPIQVASNGDPIPLLDPQSLALWRVK